MNFDEQLKIQAFLDGELPENEAREVAGLLARDSGAKALHAELKNTRRAIKESEANVRVPESREFYWSKIQREVERLEPVAATPEEASPFAWLRRLVLPLSATAVLIIAGMFAYNQVQSAGKGMLLESEVASADSGAFTYRDYSSGVTLVWLPFPAEKDLAQNGQPATIQ